MKIRFHRGTLVESLATEREIPNTLHAVCHTVSVELGRPIKPSDVTIEPHGFDERITWNTHLVCVKGQAVAYTSSPVAS